MDASHFNLEREMAVRRETFLDAARIIDGGDILELGGIMSRRKRDREDASLRLETARRVAKRNADLLRAAATNGRWDIWADLSDIDGSSYASMLQVQDAIALQERGFVNIELITRFNGWNTVPATAEYRLSLSDKGRAALGAHLAAKATAA